jgi:4-hydroxy-3-polyprenylbenzoate decarboxylase
MRSYILAITGASGSLYGLEALRQMLAQNDIQIHLVVSFWGEEVINQETGKTLSEHIDAFTEADKTRIIIYKHGDMLASISSGSFPVEGMIIAPCSMGTLCSIASGLSGNLIERAASVALKERRPLVLLARETPLSTIQLEQMVTVSRSGAIIMPPMPAFYMKPASLQELVEISIERALTQMGIKQNNLRGWKHENK